MLCHTTLAQLLVRVIPSMCHAPVCLISLRPTRRTLHFLSPFFYFILLIFHFIFFVGQFGVKAPVRFRERGVWLLANNAPLTKSVQDAASEIRRSQVRRAVKKNNNNNKTPFQGTPYEYERLKQVVQKTFIWSRRSRIFCSKPETNWRRKRAFGAPSKRCIKGKGPRSPQRKRCNRSWRLRTRDERSVRKRGFVQLEA